MKMSDSPEDLFKKMMRWIMVIQIFALLLGFALVAGILYILGKWLGVI